MKDSDKLAVEQESTEVELSAQDLLDLSPPAAEAPASPVASSQATSSGAETGAVETDSSTSDAAPRAPRARRLSAAAVMLTIGAVAAAAAAVAVIVPMDRTPEPIQTAMAPPTPAIEEPAPPEIEGPPVLFKNPFDDTEVFEFPPGTSPEEARAAVADLLVMRARERQELFDARAGNRK
jgi:hypothetical protein